MGPGSVVACRWCGAPLERDFVFCHRCGAPAVAAPYAVLAAPPAETPALRRAADYRTRRGLVATIGALLTIWVPGIAILGAILLSAGSTYLFLDRARFGPAHRTAVNVSFALLWFAAIAYALVFGVFLWEAYLAYLRNFPLDEIRPAAVRFVWVSTVPTLLVVASLAYQVRSLLPKPLKRQLPVATGILGVLVGLATVFAHLAVSGDLGNAAIRVATVTGVLDRIALARLVEAPGFLWLAFLYVRAYRTRRAAAGPPSGPAPAPSGPQIPAARIPPP